MTRPVHRNAIWPETGYSVKFRAFIEKVTAGSMIKNTAHVLYADVICPGYRYINPVNYIFSG
jgi:hypothetical protein